MDLLQSWKSCIDKVLCFKTDESYFSGRSNTVGFDQCNLIQIEKIKCNNRDGKHSITLIAT